VGDCIRRERQLVASAQFDDAQSFVGGSPSLGDLTSTGIRVPADPTPSQDKRYLARCCGVSVGINQRAIIRSIRQLVTIGADVQLLDRVHVAHFEIPVTTPTWHFQDGNVSFHLRKVTDDTIFRNVASARNVEGVSSNRAGLSAVILGFLPAGPALYDPLNAGLPYGTPIKDLGTFRDMRFPWTGDTTRDLDLEVTGPCDIELFASVHQTDPLTRIRYDGAVADIIDAVCPEDKFILRFQDARYWRVGAELIVDICSLDAGEACDE